MEKSHVSVRTIQRIENGEVLPRMSTVKILLEALGESYESFSSKPPQVMETSSTSLPIASRNTLLTAAVAGAVYLVSEIILGAMDVAWFTGDRDWGLWINAVYTSLTAVMVVSFALFARGFIALSKVFENPTLKVSAYLLIVGTIALAILDVVSLSMEDLDIVWIAYGAAAVILGALNIFFGVSLIRLQDGMGELARVAGILEIILGCLLVTIVFFFLAYVVMIPAIAIEIMVLYRGYEYLSRTESTPAL